MVCLVTNKMSNELYIVSDRFKKYLVCVPGEQYASIPLILLQYAISMTFVWFRSILFLIGLIILGRDKTANTVNAMAGRYPIMKSIRIEGCSRLQNILMYHLFEYCLKNVPLSPMPPSIALISTISFTCNTKVHIHIYIHT